jgi:hypothetical protein
MATALLVISAASAIFSGVQQRKISKQQKKQNRLTNKIAAITRRRNIKKQIAASRIQIAQQQAAGFTLGVSGSTSVAGAVAGVTSDTASTIGASNLQSVGQGFIAGFQDNISDLSGSIGISNAIGGLAGAIGANEKAVAGLEDLFGFGGE